MEDHAEQMNETSPKMKPELSKDRIDHQFQNSPTSSLTGSNDSIQASVQKSSSVKVNRPPLFPLLRCLFMFPSLKACLTTAGEAENIHSAS